MKRIFLIALSLTAHHIIAMDTPSSFVKTSDSAKATSDASAGAPIKAIPTQTNNNAAFDEMIALIDQKINEKYLTFSLLEQFSVFGKKEENYRNILLTPKTIYPNIVFTENLFDKLYAKNSIFAQAIDYLVDYDLERFKNVTPANLNTVNDLSAPQPIPLFNELDPSIRKYILQRATNKIEHECTMKIVTGATVIDFDICPATDTVAISTGDKQTPYRLRLWDLKRVAPLHTFEEENPVNFVCFNTPGNQLAALVVMADKSKIKIWNPQSKQLLHTIIHDPRYRPDILIYNDHATNHLLHGIYHNAPRNPNEMETFLISSELCLPCGFSPVELFTTSKEVVDRGNYRAVHPNEDSLVTQGMIAAGLKALTLDVVKSNCSDLYLCEQATKKAQNKQSLTLITQSNPFKTATEYEQNIIRTSVEAKRKQLTS